MTSSRVLTHEEWIVEFKPIANPKETSRNSFGPAQDEIELLGNYPRNMIWSQIWDFYDERNSLFPGMYPPSESSEDIYFVTEIPWDQENIQVLMPYD